MSTCVFLPRCELRLELIMGGGQSHEEKDEERPGKTKEDQEVDRAGSSASKGEQSKCSSGEIL